MTTIFFDEKCIPNNDYVVIRIIDNAELLKAGNIILSETAFQNEKLAFGQIEAVGKNAAKEYLLKPGQYCLFDRLATFYHTAPVCVVEYNNVIVLTNKDRSEYSPVGGTMFVEENKETAEEKKGVFVVASAEDQLHVGTITQMNLREEDDFPFAVGDKVMLTKGADHVKLGTRTVFVYKPESVIVRFNNRSKWRFRCLLKI